MSMNENPILNKAFQAGQSNRGKSLEEIERLAEIYIKAQPYEALSLDDAIFAAFVQGATGK